MKRFCLGIQAGAPVDSYVTPEPWEMPGYDCPVIMAAGAFVQGSSIELSADGPAREPYTVYMQGGLTYESGKLGIMMAVQCHVGQAVRHIMHGEVTLCIYADGIAPPQNTPTRRGASRLQQKKLLI